MRLNGTVALMHECAVSGINHAVVLADRRIDEVQLRIKEQTARLQRTIVQGFPSQSADDLLSKLYVNLDKLKKGRRT
jgi:hypothetical protein